MNLSVIKVFPVNTSPGVAGAQFPGRLERKQGAKLRLNDAMLDSIGPANFSLDILLKIKRGNDVILNDPPMSGHQRPLVSFKGIREGDFCSALSGLAQNAEVIYCSPHRYPTSLPLFDLRGEIEVHSHIAVNMCLRLAIANNLTINSIAKAGENTQTIGLFFQWKSPQIDNLFKVYEYYLPVAILREVSVADDDRKS